MGRRRSERRPRVRRMGPERLVPLALALALLAPVARILKVTVCQP